MKVDESVSARFRLFREGGKYVAAMRNEERLSLSRLSCTLRLIAVNYESMGRCMEKDCNCLEDSRWNSE